jgi:hypothetical protein
MRRRKLFASIPMGCLLSVGLLGMAPAANATAAGLSLLKPATHNVIEIKHRGRPRRLYLPIGPNYLAYDYPYYYSRGFYPKHIGRGYVYYGYPYLSAKRYRSRCAYWRRRCVAHLRHRSHHGQRGACRCR